ncbi:MAG TPA: hypothetical protein VMI31_14755 [Fimbriimonadaceae bacterium]|nr:hypothetical protein [Fimbriimonadaceae bacterium]
MSRKLVSTAFLVVAAAGVGLYLSRGPWLAYRQERQKSDAATNEMLKSEADKNDLIRQKAKLDTPIGREELARDLGYRKSGEQPVETGN